MQKMIKVVVGIAFLSASFVMGQTSPDRPDRPSGVREPSGRPFRFPLNPGNPPTELKANLDSFFAGLVEGNAAKAFDGLVKGQPLAEREDELKFFVNMTQQAMTLYGKSTGFELLDSKPAGTHLLCLTYVTTHKKAPLRWRIMCYKPEKNWILVDVVFDDGFKDWFE